MAPLFGAHAPSGAGAGETARAAVEEVSGWVRRLARLGYAARGVVYLLTGYIALRAALPAGRGSPTDSSGALRLFGDGPTGRVLLAVLAVGLLGFACWRVVQATLDPERRADGAKGVALRATHAFSALVHLALGVEAVRLAALRAAGGSSDATRHWTAVAMERDLGRWAVLAVGAVVMVAAVRELSKALGPGFGKRLRFREMPAEARRPLERLGRLGTGARGVVFGLIGWFLIAAARHADASEARGFGGALTSLREQSHGLVLLGVVAAGLMAFGVWQLVEARYRTIRV